ncbi:MAG: hypothetical protein GXY76_01320 [Chloroflexi bacterium]|nr:hypothetical protein [Chloroflexota bacterium]
MTRKHLAICLLAMMVWLLIGCEVPAPGTPLPTITPLPTATPTVTSTATATVPPTATLEPRKPSPEPTATPLPPTDTPAPTATATPDYTKLWPAPPAAFSDYAEAILAYLNESPVHIVRLRAMLGDWRAITDRLGGIQEADVDSDGAPEWIVTIADPAPLTLTVPGEMLILDRTGNTYQIIYRVSAEMASLPENLAVIATQDVNADGRIELAYTTTTCGAHTCLTAARVLAWDGAAFQPLTVDQIELAYGEVSFENRDGDPALELLMHGGVVGSVGAGPQRARTDVYDWNGSRYELEETLYDASDFLYFKVLDANAAFTIGDYTRAIALYQEAIDNQELRAWRDWDSEGQKEKDDLRAFARYRLMVVYVLVNDLPNAEAVAIQMQDEQPDHVYTQVSQIFLDYYVKMGTVPAACRAVTAFAFENPEAAAVLADYGYANPSFTPEEVCPIGLNR